MCISQEQNIHKIVPKILPTVKSKEHCFHCHVVLHSHNDTLYNVTAMYIGGDTRQRRGVSELTLATLFFLAFMQSSLCSLWKVCKWLNRFGVLLCGAGIPLMRSLHVVCSWWTSPALNPKILLNNGWWFVLRDECFAFCSRHLSLLSSCLFYVVYYSSTLDCGIAANHIHLLVGGQHRDQDKYVINCAALQPCAVE